MKAMNLPGRRIEEPDPLAIDNLLALSSEEMQIR
jgi:hypothetical protein